ncbi:MAG: hypothetical protein EPN25_15305 [Nitrospirae bacterium]|nr:MAG: hypothetical protein EPN25_15305 [Nitrospirota bacterium]
MLPVEERIRNALSAEAADLWTAVKDPHPEVLTNAVCNPHFSEDMAFFTAKRKNVPAEVLSLLAGDRRFKDSYKLKLLLCRNPRTPQRVVFSLLKFLRIFDLADITRDQHVHINVRQKIEQMITEKLRSLPLGIKIALARRAHSNILLAVMEAGDESVIQVCLENPALTEGQICKLIAMPSTKAPVIRQITRNEKWTLRYYVRYALIRNLHTPLTRVVKFIPGIKTVDLRDLYADQKLPLATRPFIYRELADRGEDVEMPQEEVYALSGDEDRHLTGEQED